MAELKTKQTKQSVEEFLDTVESEQKRRDSFAIIKIMEHVTHEKPVMWGPSIIGFGKYHYKYESGHEGDMCIAGFSPRKQHIVVYLMLGLADTKELLEKLGKHKTSAACLYIKKLSDINVDVLKTLIERSVEYVKTTYKSG